MRTIKFAIVAIMCVSIVLAVSGCSSSGSKTPATSGSGTTSSGGNTAGAATIVEKGFAFDPASLEVKVGDTVTFTNEDTAPHNVSIDGKTLGDQTTGASVTWKAEKVGSFPYSCTIHPSMTGEIVVK